jgi:ligand-binding SRPBCC domain-containing protein
MKYRHRFEVNAPLNKVADFHGQSQSMVDITPPPLKVQVHQAPAQLMEGDEMDFTLRAGPMAIHWLARIENVGPNGFTDRQLSGPFRHWMHRHRFEAIDPTKTAVVDEIEFSLRAHLWWGWVGLGMGLTLPILFAYRGWRTQRLLNGTAKSDKNLESNYVR